MSFLKKLFGGGDDKNKKQEEIDLDDEDFENDAFAVVSGNIVTREGAVKPFVTIVPTIFGVLGDDDDDDEAEIDFDVIAWETIMLALDAADEQYPDCEWQNEEAVEVRHATEEETKWALENGINDKFLE